MSQLVVVACNGMLPLNNEHVKGLTKPTEHQKFRAEYVEELIKGTVFSLITATSLINMDSAIVMLRINLFQYIENDYEGKAGGLVGKCLSRPGSVLLALASEGSASSPRVK